MKRIQDHENMLGVTPVRKTRLPRFNLEMVIGITFCLLLAILIMMVVGTITNFIPSANAIMAEQADMRQQLDQMAEDQTAMSERIAQWPGITEGTEPVVTTTAVPTEPVGEWMDFKITAYCACLKCCGKTNGITASGNMVREGYTVAADWSVLPNGTVVEIEGVGIRTVEDNGVKGNQIDLYMLDHQTALNWGVQHLRVRIVG